MPKQIPPQESLPFPEPVPAPDHPAPDQAMASARPRTPARDVRPWWARLLGRLLDPWIALDVVPEAPGYSLALAPGTFEARSWPGGSEWR